MSDFQEHLRRAMREHELALAASEVDCELCATRRLPLFKTPERGWTCIDCWMGTTRPEQIAPRSSFYYRPATLEGFWNEAPD